jgi:hypothetical protein
MTLAPRVDQWVVAIAACADLSLIAGLRGNRSAQMRLATQAVDLASEHGLLDATEVGEVHKALGLALAAQGRPEEALPELTQGLSSTGDGGSRSKSSMGCSRSRQPPPLSAITAA